MAAERPRVILSCAVSLDGRIDDASPERLRLSNEADFDEVDELRASCDAILVGAGTVRADNPRLLVRSPDRRRRRLAEGRTAHLRKVVLSGSGALDPAARIFTTGDAGCLVYVADDALATAERRFAGLGGVEVVAAGQPVRLVDVLADLARRGVRRLLVEGGAAVHTAFLTQDLADELRLAVAPFLVGDERAPRFVHPGDFPQRPDRPMRLVEARSVGDMAVLRYVTGEDR
ncbi:dihydrofolate reductase family protein [Thermobifida halotolerans]|uniref:Dihydrofolate reductase family protein n=1 Tax=Thermobifida halotolerans TaxID=483545 RepID=A0A399G536_9ACTN|nr:dihydrofolate reductase family protein [Thermobifida halotolerans]UOE19975.1 dihydrofolate reductase family protein [Thermobifida halotolerans]